LWKKLIFANFMLMKIDEKTMMVRLSAFKLYKKEGMDKVKKRYPDQVSFVEMYRHKSLETIKKELLQQLYVYA